MPVPSVFISSVQRDYGSIREGAATAISTLGFAPLKAEGRASPSSPKTALLDLVAQADYVLVLIGSRYGDPGASGYSPTEDEFQEARRRGKQIIVLVQDVGREPATTEFLERARGGWEDGILYDTFIDESDIERAVVRAFAPVLSGRTGEDTVGAARRARELAAGDDRRGSFQSGAPARVVFVPTRSEVLLDAVALELPSLGDVLANAARQSNVIANQFGIDTTITAAGVTLQATGGTGWAKPSVTVKPDGTVIVEDGVADEGLMGGMAIQEARLDTLITNAAAFTRAAWSHIDGHSTVNGAAVALALLDASMKGWRSASGPPSNSMSLGGNVPATLVVPETGAIVQRSEVTSVNARLLAEARRVFRDAGRVT